MNIIGVWFYNLTPIATYCYRIWQGEEAEIGFVWASWYPFDKHQPIAHVACYCFEAFAGKHFDDRVYRKYVDNQSIIEPVVCFILSKVPWCVLRSYASES